MVKYGHMSFYVHIIIKHISLPFISKHFPTMQAILYIFSENKPMIKTHGYKCAQFGLPPTQSSNEDGQF